MIADITLREFIAGLFLAGGAFFLLASAIAVSYTHLTLPTT